MTEENTQENTPVESNDTPEAENGAPFDSEKVDDAPKVDDDDEPAHMPTTAERRAEAMRIAKDK